MEIKSIREFLSWVDQKVFFLDENEGSVCLKNGEKAEDSLIEPYTMKLLISDIKKHSYLWEKHENHAYTLKRQYQMDYVPEIPVPTAEQTEFFKKSVCKGEDGILIPFFHGTGTEITEFDGEMTGQGNDQYGSGFYFTSNFKTARSYMFQRMQGNDGMEMEKIGGEDYYNVLSVYLDIRHPLYIDGMENPNLSHIYLNDVEKISSILEHHPDLYLAPDEDGEWMNPIGDYLDEYWELPFDEMEKEDFIPYIRKMAAEFFDNTNLYILDNFFVNYPQEFRTALRDVLGYDGVIVRFKEGCHAIAWFPEQIKSVYNQNTLSGRKINQ